MKVYIKAYGWCDIIKQEGSLALIKVGESKLVYNILGLDITLV
jgi:hypothetical protein